jgi:hypothetical protein
MATHAWQNVYPPNQSYMEKIVVWCMLVMLVSCQKEEYFGPIGSENSNIIETQTKELLYIGCEGNFQYSNASLSVLDLAEDSVENDVFSRANDYELGDVLQSILHVGDSLFLVVNNSGVIRIVNDSTFKEIDVIDGFNSPRHMVMLDKSLAVVSDFGGKHLTLLDIASAEIVRSVPSSDWTERMLVNAGALYVASMRDSALLMYEPTNLSLVSSIALDVEPAYLFSINETIYVIGNDRAGGARLISITSTLQKEEVERFDSRISGAALYASSCYVLFNSRVSQLNIEDGSSRSFSHEAKTPYSIFVDEKGVYISDVDDYLSRGKVLKYDHDFGLINTYQVGLIPQAFSR